MKITIENYRKASTSEIKRELDILHNQICKISDVLKEFVEIDEKLRTEHEMLLEIYKQRKIRNN